MKLKKTLLVPISVFLILAAACTTTKEHYLIASTGTVIGVELSQDPVNQSPKAKLGYNRAELAIIPTNRAPCVLTGSENEKKFDCGSVQGTRGAADTANVLMELRYNGIFSSGADSGIYQRLAVGDLAVTQTGAAVMFAKNTAGEVDQNTVDALDSLRYTSLEQKRLSEGVAKIINSPNADSIYDQAASIMSPDFQAIYNRKKGAGIKKSMAFMSAKNNYLSIGEPIRSERMEEINQALETVMKK